MTREEIEELKGLAASMGLYDDKNPCKRAVILGKAIKALEQEPVLNKIREQMKDYLGGVEITLEVLVENDPLRPKMEGAKSTLEECLELIDKAESEAADGHDD